MDKDDIERLRQRVADLQKKMERVGLQKKEETVDEDEGVAAVTQIGSHLGSQPYQTEKPEWSHIPLVGLRSFRFAQPDRMTGLAYQWPWEPGENVALCGHSDEVQEVLRNANPMQAMMMAGRRLTGHVGYNVKHRLADCSHGFYSLLDVDHFNSNGPGYIDGMIEGYGEVIAGPDGFRCEKAKIVALVLPNADGALGTIEEEKQNAEKAAKPKRKWRRDSDVPPRLVAFLSRHDELNGLLAAVCVMVLLGLVMATAVAPPLTLLLLAATPLPGYLLWAAWAADFSPKWGIGSDYWRSNTYPPELLQYLGRHSMLEPKWANKIIERYGVPAYKTVEAMLERHPIERGEA